MLKDDLQKQTVTAADMVHLTPRTISEERAALSNVNVGDYVDVAYDYMPGTCSDGGIGIITSLINLHDDPAIREADKLYATVKYIIGGGVEHSIEMFRLTVVRMPFKDKGVTLRARKIVKAPPEVVTPVVKHTPLEWLKLGLTSRKHETKGWLRKLLIENKELHPTDDDMLWKRVVSDFKCQESFREGMKEVLVMDIYTMFPQ